MLQNKITRQSGIAETYERITTRNTRQSATAYRRQLHRSPARVYALAQVGARTVLLRSPAKQVLAGAVRRLRARLSFHSRRARRARALVRCCAMGRYIQLRHSRRFGQHDKKRSI